ncbi:MAG: hypothetical protein EPO08_14510 [Rhodospirillaceae bacterium]|nr:MAG: hypothetical protein EPO08_14510 [Rhodospirillaceae bacterium]
MFSIRFQGAPIVRDSGATLETLDAATAKEIERVWDAAQARRGTPLFNGTLFSVDAIQAAEICGHFVEYKWFIAVREIPGLQPILRIQPLAVTGVLRCADGIVFGRRSQVVTQDQGLWELVPAGGLSVSCRQPDGTLDVGAQILEELEEEIGLGRKHVTRMRPFCVVEDTATHVFDVAIEVVTSASKDAIESAFRMDLPREYDAIEIIADTEVEAFVEQHGQDLAPLSAFLLQRVAVR